MSSTPDLVPLALMYTTSHHHVLHERVVILTIRTDEAPHVPAAERAWVEPLGNEFWRLAAVYGFMEDPDVPSLLRHVAELEPRLDIDPRQATFFLGQETILAGEAPGGMAEWREHLFSFMARNATKATKFFGLPVDRVVEVGHLHRDVAGQEQRERGQREQHDDEAPATVAHRPGDERLPGPRQQDAIDEGAVLDDGRGGEPGGAVAAANRLGPPRVRTTRRAATRRAADDHHGPVFRRARGRGKFR
jgi:hypothetical protein